MIRISHSRIIRFGGFMHGLGASIQCTGMAIVKEKRETVSHEECIHTALLHYNCSSVDSSLSESPLLQYSREKLILWESNLIIYSAELPCKVRYHGKNANLKLDLIVPLS